MAELDVRILSQALKNRYSGELEVGLWEEFELGVIAVPARWIVTTKDRPDKQWEYEDIGQALRHFEQLKRARTRPVAKLPVPKEIRR